MSSAHPTDVVHLQGPMKEPGPQNGPKIILRLAETSERPWELLCQVEIWTPRRPLHFCFWKTNERPSPSCLNLELVCRMTSPFSTAPLAPLGTLGDKMHRQQFTAITHRKTTQIQRIGVTVRPASSAYPEHVDIQSRRKGEIGRKYILFTFHAGIHHRIFP